MENLTSHQINDNTKIFILDIKELNSSLTDLINKHFVKICEWNSWTDINEVKIRLKNYLDSKRWTDLEKWSVAEFFIHLFLNELWFKQECMFFNLEENSIKKWFDWYYSLNWEEWIMESKSGSISSQNVTHEEKIKKWFDDLKWKVWEKQSNNPWANAYNHARHGDINTDISIARNIKVFSSDYINEIFYDIWDFNIIPASTIFLNGTWEEIDKTDLKNKIETKISTFSFNKIIAVCVTKKTIQLIYNYLEI